MSVVRGRPIHFDLTEESRELFESIIISRFSVRDQSDEVLRTDDGLSRFGLAAVAEMNRLGILIDLSHVGDRTTLDAIENSVRRGRT